VSTKAFTGTGHRLGDLPPEIHILPPVVGTPPRAKLTKSQQEYIYSAIFLLTNAAKLILSCLVFSSKVTISGPALAGSVLGLELIMLESQRRQMRLQKKICSFMFAIQIISFIISVVTIAEVFKHPIKKLQDSAIGFISQAILWIVIEIFRHCIKDSATNQERSLR
jgi:hypothetical protein